VGGFYHFEKINLSKLKDPKDLIPMLEKPDEILDIAFTEVFSPLDLFQEEIDFRYFKVEKGSKIFIGAETAAAPDKEKLYGFYGKIQQNVRGKLLYSRPTFKYDLTYHRTEGQYHIFLVPEKVIVSDEYKGCSGAPILDGNGNIVAVACAVRKGFKMLYGFSILECMKLIDSALASETVQK
jgi:hypothetical protein